MKKYYFIAGFAIALVSCKQEKTNETTSTEESTPTETVETTKTETRTYSINAKSDTKTSGTVTFTQKRTEVIMTIEAQNLTPGTHAVHIHEFGDCSAADASSAGGHWNPSTDNHGKWGGDHHHMGDIGNLEADANGNATLTFSTDKWSLGGDVSTNILGKTLIIHADKDDFQTQPTGNAGGRVGCVEIK